MTANDHTLVIPDEEWQKLEARATERGFDDPAAYLRALIDADREIEAESDAGEDDYEDDDETILKSLRQGFREAMRGEGIPIDEVWAMLDEDEA